MSIEELKTWIISNGFIDTPRSWSKPQDKGIMFYSYKNGNYRVEIKYNWDKKYGDTYSEIVLSILNCEKEIYSDGSGIIPYLGWMGQSYLVTLNNPKSINLLNELLKHYNI